MFSLPSHLQLWIQALRLLSESGMKSANATSSPRFALSLYAGNVGHVTNKCDGHALIQSVSAGIARACAGGIR